MCHCRGHKIILFITKWFIQISNGRYLSSSGAVNNLHKTFLKIVLSFISKPDMICENFAGTSINRNED